MTRPILTHLVRHDGPGEKRVAAIDGEGRAWRLFTQRWGGIGEAARLGEVKSGRLRAVADAQGGAFVELDTGETAFMAGAGGAGLRDGEQALFKVLSEARRGKAARVLRVLGGETTQTAFDAWLSSIPGGAQLPCADDERCVDAAFDEALADRVTLPGGGHLHVERTRALSALDVDTAGRIAKGSAGARALAVNRAAAREAARQVALRDLGGAVVLDCIAPLNREAGEKVRAQFIDTLQAVTLRKVQVLAPSRFGLMEAAVEWGACPLADRTQLADGEPTGETGLLAALRTVEREARANGGALLRLDLPPSLMAAYRDRRQDCDALLQARFGGRVEIGASDDDKVAVRRR